MSTTIERVRNVVVDKLQRNPDEVTETASFQDDLGADSLDVVELVMGFEDEFGIQISDDDAEKIKTVGQAALYIDGKTSAV